MVWRQYDVRIFTAIVSIVLLYSAPATADTPLLLFLDSICGAVERQVEIVPTTGRAEELLEVSGPDKKRAIRSSIRRLKILHELFTGSGAVNGVAGGAFEIPYFWHWTSPNPRHSIRHLPDSMLLIDLLPPGGFERYRSWADVDRTPVLYLADLVTEKPQYYYPGYGSFYTFGWCSEREMAFTALLTELGYESKIVQQGIHVWSEVLLPIGKGRDEHTLFLKVRIDNTFRQFNLDTTRTELSEWRKDIGEGQSVEWYNRQARSVTGLTNLDSILVGDKAEKRLKTAIREYFNLED